jgi:hypothetical protein
VSVATFAGGLSMSAPGCGEVEGAKAGGVLPLLLPQPARPAITTTRLSADKDDFMDPCHQRPGWRAIGEV